MATPQTRERHRLKSPSINWPETEPEAAMALIHSARHALFDDLNDGRNGALTREYTMDVGLGRARRQEMADWLNRQQEILRTALEDVLDRFEARILHEAGDAGPGDEAA